MATATDALTQIIREAVREAITDEMRPVKQRLLAISDAAEYLGISEEALRDKAYNNMVPMVRIDRRMRFDIRDLDQLIDRSKK